MSTGAILTKHWQKEKGGEKRPDTASTVKISIIIREMGSGIALCRRRIIAVLNPALDFPSWIVPGDNALVVKPLIDRLTQRSGISHKRSAGVIQRRYIVHSASQCRSCKACRACTQGHGF